MFEKAKKNNYGFTLAEMLIAVAIITILSGIAIVSLTRYQRNLRLMEMNSIAKDIFIVSQNHLSEAKAAGKINLSSYTAVDSDKAEATNEDNLCILGSSKGAITYSGPELDSSSDHDKYAKLIVPAGSIDAHVRNGYFTVKFDPVTATVLEVFYSENYDVTAADYSDLESIRNDKNARKNYDGGGIIGYYGETNGLDKKKLLASPKIIIHNEEILYVEIVPSEEFTEDPEHFYDTDSGKTVKVLLQDETNHLLNDVEITVDATNSNVKDGKIYVVLDDISSSSNRIMNYFSAVNPALAGSNIKVRVEITDSTHYGNTASSPQETVNSLFGERDEDDNVSINNMRHFINLGADSGFTSHGTVSAEQKTNFEWGKFKSAVERIHLLTVRQYMDGDAEENTHFVPPVLDYHLEYDGKKLAIDGIDETGLTSDAGLFGKTTAKLEVKNLEIRNMNIKTTSGYAGALLGSADGTNGEIITNSVIAYNTLTRSETDPKVEIATTDKGAGGLVGNMVKGTITDSAASVYVSGNTTAGGLVGTMINGTISSSYSGGHTNNGEYLMTDSNQEGHHLEGRPNVVASGATGLAGGLVGSAGTTATITKSYATASVMGNTADPLVNGIISEDSTGFGWICSESYTGLAEDDKYPDVTIVSAFINGGSAECTPYDTTLKNKKYPFKSIHEENSESTAWFLKEHVGDWALPGEKVEVINYPN